MNAQDFLCSNFALPSTDTGTPAVPTPFAAQSDGTATNYLSGGDAATLRVTANDSFIIAGWIKVDDLPVVAAVPICKGSAQLGTDTYSFTIDPAGGVYFNVAQTMAGNGAGVDSGSALVADTKYFLLAWVDAAGHTVNFQINDGTPESAAIDETAIVDLGGSFQLFADDGPLLGTDGILDEWFFCKNPANLASALSLINTTIYNAGSGITYGSLSGANKTTLGLVSWWTLDDDSGVSRTDSQGSNTLSLNGTISQVTALVS